MCAAAGGSWVNADPKPRTPTMAGCHALGRGRGAPQKAAGDALGQCLRMARAPCLAAAACARPPPAAVPGQASPSPSPAPSPAHPSASMRGTALTSRQRFCAVGRLLATNDSSWPGSGWSPLITLRARSRARVRASVPGQEAAVDVSSTHSRVAARCSVRGMQQGLAHAVKPAPQAVCASA